MNSIWFFLIIPLVVTVFLFIRYRSKLAWWEVPTLWGVSVLAIFLCQIIYAEVISKDEEYWGFNGVSAYYDEPYEYWTTCSESYACGTSCTGSGKTRSCSTRYCTRYYPCTKWAGDEAFLTDQVGERRISKDRFYQIANSIWKNKTFVELNREKKEKIQTDGDRWTAKWPGTWKTSVPIAETHAYENKVNTSSSIYFRPVSKDDIKFWGLYDYPSIGSNAQTSTILDNTGKNWGDAQTYLMYANGELGVTKRCRVWVLVFRTADRAAAQWQKDYWKNGNKNEVVVCIGIDKENNVLWGDCFGWTHSEDMKIDIKDYIMQSIGVLNEESFLNLGLFLYSEIGSNFTKPEFTEEYKYLSVEPSTTAKIIIFAIIVMVCVGVAIFIILNDSNGKDPIKEYNKKYNGDRFTFPLDIEKSKRKVGLINRSISNKRPIGPKRK